jgi:hypothetical protein
VLSLALRCGVVWCGVVCSHDWKKCRALFTDTVEVDYSALTGQPNAMVDANVLMDGWSHFIPVCIPRALCMKETPHISGSVVLRCAV